MVDYEGQMESRVATFEQRLQQDVAATVRAAVQAQERKSRRLPRTLPTNAPVPSRIWAWPWRPSRASSWPSPRPSRSPMRRSSWPGSATRCSSTRRTSCSSAQWTSARREAIRNGVSHIQKYFEGIFAQRVGEMQQQYEGRYRDLAESMMAQGRAELLRTEAHVGGEHQAMAARLRLESEELASVERCAATAARWLGRASSERSLHLASVREEKHVEFVESEASDRERALRSELADHDRALRQELRDQDTHWRAELRHAGEQVVAIATQEAIATRDARRQTA